MNSDEHIRELKDFIFNRLVEEDLIVLSDPSVLDPIIFQSPMSLRLRKAGFHLLSKIYDHEKFELKEKLNGRELLTLKNHVGWPYFLPQDHSYIVLFTIKESFFLKLQGGNVKKWLKQIYNKNSNKNKDL